MSDKRREQTEKNMKSMTPNEFLANLPQKGSTKKSEKASKVGDKIKGFFGILGSLGLFPVFSSTKPSGRRGHGGGGHASNHQTSNMNHQASNTPFRDTYHFDPSRAYMERIQETAYLKMIDGKGDPEPCDCDHDR